MDERIMQMGSLNLLQMQLRKFDKYKVKQDDTEDVFDSEEDTRLLSLFNGKSMPDPKTGWEMYEKGIAYDENLRLFDTVKNNENFFVGKQWEGVPANGLPTPQINILKRVALFTIATIVSDNTKVTASALANTVGTSNLKQMIRVINDEYEAIFERNKIPALIREYATNAAVDGDGCIYVYWDADEETGQQAKGGIKCEIIENTRVFFGNPSDNRVEQQPWIIISRRMTERNARLLAKNNGSPDWRNIKASTDEIDAGSLQTWNDELVTVLNLFWKNDETGEVWTYCYTLNAEIDAPKSLGIKRYPITWLNWDRVHDSYHGQAMITGLIPNQIAVNKSWAMATLSLMNQGFPTRLYDKTKISKVTNQVGAVYGVNGDTDRAMKVVEGTAVPPQVFQFITSMTEQTEQSLGATSVALGDSRPDNTSAIIALQRAASTPSELTKQNIYNSVVDLARIFNEFMGEYYGTRYVDRPIKEREREAAQFAQQANPDLEIPEEVPELFDFSQLKLHPVQVKLDAGASTYYSEIASIQTLENLLMQQQINVIQFLERLPDDYVPDRMGLISELKNQQAQMQAMQQQMAAMPPEGGEVPPLGDIAVQGNEKMEINGGKGNGAIQRQINKTGTTEGLI